MPVTDDQVFITVVIEIEELYTPSAIHLCGGRDAGRSRIVGECVVAEIAIDREHLAIEVGDEQVLPPIVVEVGCVYTHARPGCAVAVVGNSGIESNLLK